MRFCDKFLRQLFCYPGIVNKKEAVSEVSESVFFMDLNLRVPVYDFSDGLA